MNRTYEQPYSLEGCQGSVIVVYDGKENVIATFVAGINGIGTVSLSISDSEPTTLIFVRQSDGKRLSIVVVDAADVSAIPYSDSIPLPLPSVIRLESRLSPEQVRADMEDEEALDAEIATREQAQAGYVSTRLTAAAAPISWPLSCSAIRKRFDAYTQEHCNAYTANQQRQAALAVKLRVLGSLYRSSGMGAEFYQKIADSYYADAENILKTLEMSISDVAKSDSPAGIGVYTLTTGSGNYDNRLPEATGTMP